MKKDTFIVGDIHGCFEEFLALLKKLNYHSKKQRLILVGDLIGKGPYSLKVLEWVRKHNIEVVRGNHEQCFIDGVKNNNLLKWPILEKLKRDMKTQLTDWLEWLQKTPFYIEEKDFLVVHAGLVPGKKIHPDQAQLLMNIRTWDGEGKDIKSSHQKAWHHFYKKEKLVIYGHWAAQGLKIKKNSVGLDSGCVYGKQLSGILLPERTLLQVQALKTYYLWTLDHPKA